MGRKVWLLLLAGMLLSGCGIHLVSPRGDTVNTFLRRVNAHCGTFSIGGQPISAMFTMRSEEPYLFDLTSDLATGAISRDEYAKTVNGSYRANHNEQGISCILKQLDMLQSKKTGRKTGPWK